MNQMILLVEMVLRILKELLVHTLFWPTFLAAILELTSGSLYKKKMVILRHQSNASTISTSLSG
jgi:hypothetical protein